MADKAKTEKKVEKKAAKAEVSREEFDGLAGKVRRMNENWHDYCEKHIGSGAVGGKIAGALLAACMFAGVSFGADLVNYPTPSGGAGFSVDDSGNATIGGTLTVNGAMTFTGAITASSTLTVAGDLTANSDIVMEQDVTLRNDTVGDFEMIFTNETAVLGQVIFDTAADQSVMADNDLYEIIFRGPDSASNATDYAGIKGQITDNTTATENGGLIFFTTADGSDVVGMTLEHSAGGVHSLAIVPNTAITGTLTVNGSTIAGDNNTTITAMSNITSVAGATWTLGTATIVPTSASELTISETTVTVSGTTLAAPALTATSATVSGAITANGTIAGDNDTTITGISNTTWVAGSTLTPGASTIVLVSGGSITMDATTCVTSNQTFLSSTGVTNTLVIVDGLIKQIN